MWFKHAQGEHRGYFHHPGSARGAKEIILGEPLSSLFTVLRKQSQDFSERAPLAASLEALVTNAGKSWAGKSDKGVQSTVRHLKSQNAPAGKLPAFASQFPASRKCEFAEEPSGSAC